MGKRSVKKERFWRRMIAKQEKSAATVRGFCDAHDLNEHQFYSWRRELCRRDTQEQPADSTRLMVPLDIVVDEPLPSGSVEIVLADQVRLRVAGEFDPAALAALVAALERRGC